MSARIFPGSLAIAQRLLSPAVGGYDCACPISKKECAMLRQLRRPSLVLLVLSLPPLVRLATWTSPAPQPVDLAAAAKGHELFEHVWTPNDPLAGTGDGLGPVFNASSCLACHRQGGIGGSGSRARITSPRSRFWRREVSPHGRASFMPWRPTTSFRKRCRTSIRACQPPCLYRRAASGRRDRQCRDATCLEPSPFRAAYTSRSERLRPSSAPN